MKITIVQGAFLPIPALLGGAVEKVWTALGHEFAGRGHEVTHISRRYGSLSSDEMVDGVRHIRIPGFDAPRSLLVLKALDLLYSKRVLRHLPAADILVTNTFWLPILSRDPKRGKIFVHVARYPKGQMRFYSGAARLQTVSQPVARAIQREAPSLASRVRVIPYPLIGTNTNGSRASLRPHKEKQILFVGRIHPEKGVHLLIQAVAALPRDQTGDWRLVIVGPSEVRLGGGGSAYLRRLQQLAEPIADRVDWIGPVFEPRQLAEFYSRAAIFAYPSLADHGETFGLAPLEAMDHACVPVVSNLPCFHDFIQDRQDGLFFDHHAHQPERQLSDCLIELICDQNLRSTLSTAAMHKAETYDLPHITSLFLEDFQTLCGNSEADLSFTGIRGA